MAVLIAILSGLNAQDWLRVCQDTPGVEARVVSSAADLGEPQALVIPDCPVSEDDVERIEAFIERG